MILIAAAGANRVIGNQGRMPWNVPQEYAQFLELIRGQAVIMGRRSWEIFGGDLTSASNIVVSRSGRDLAGATVVSSVDAARQFAEDTGLTVFSAGGAQIYRATLPFAKALYLSTIKGEFEGDAYFPEFDPADWRLSREEDHAAFTFRVWERESPRAPASVVTSTRL